MRKYKRVYTTGAFDPFHYGHLNILRSAKSMSEELIVGVSTDDLIFEAKKRKCFMPLSDRMEIIKELKCVDKVIVQYDKNKQRVVEELSIDAIVVGSDWKGHYPNVNCELIYIEYTEYINSTLIRNYLSDEKNFKKI